MISKSDFTFVILFLLYVKYFFCFKFVVLVYQGTYEVAPDFNDLENVVMKALSNPSDMKKRQDFRYINYFNISSKKCKFCLKCANFVFATFSYLVFFFSLLM